MTDPNQPVDPQAEQNEANERGITVEQLREQKRTEQDKRNKR